MAGIDFHGHDTEIIISSTSGPNKDELVLRDVLSRNILWNVNKIRLKLIYTRNNFKIELYDNLKLIYDGLRFYDTSVLGDIKSGKHFVITTNYENVSYEKHFILTNVNLLKRSEYESYDPHQKNSIIVNDVDFEIEHTIADLEYFMSYLEHIFGKPEGSTILQGIIGGMQEAKDQKNSLEKLKEIIKNSSFGVGDLPKTINETELKLQMMIRKINDLKYFLKSFEKNQKKNGNR
ncbi:hypothetical protein COBT_004054, partial [Conglomerata obtusa]